MGIQWDPITDSISLSVNLTANVVTRRGILAAFSQFFNPIGLIQPLLLLPKILIKSLCLLKLNWNDEITHDLRRRWLNWLKQVDCIKSVS